MRLSVLVLLLVSAASAAVFRGRVLDSRFDKPVAAAEVRIQPLNLATTTDADGRFAFATDSMPDWVSVFVTRLGYEARAFHNTSPTLTATLRIKPLPYRQPEVVSTASRSLPQGIDRPSVRYYLDKLKPRGRSDVAEVLADAPSVVVQEYGNLSTVSVRGSRPEQVEILLDGVRLNSSLNNLADLTLVPVSAATSVEVLPGGANRGVRSSSPGGVVRLGLPYVHRRSAGVDLGAGSFGRKQTRATLMVPGRVQVYATGGYLGADNDFPYLDSLDSSRVRRNSDVTRGDILAKVSGSPDRNENDLSLLGSYVFSRRGTPGPQNWPTDSARQNDRRLIAVGSWRTHVGTGPLQVALHHQQQWQNFFNPAGYFPANDTHQSYGTGLDLDASRWLYLRGDGFPLQRRTPSWLPETEFSAGLKALREDTRSTAVGAPLRWSGAAWAALDCYYRRLVLQPSLRYDLLSSAATPDSGFVVSSGLAPRLAAGWVIGGNRWLQLAPLTVSVSRTQRFPTFNELYWPADLFTSGNPGLKPEQALSADISFGGYRPDWRLAGYFSDYTNLIQWLPDTAGKWRPENVDVARILGAEASAEVSVLAWLGLSGSASYKLARALGKDLPYRPRLTGNLSVWVEKKWPRGIGKLTTERLRLVAKGRGVSARFTDALNSDALPAYATLDLEAEFELGVVTLRTWDYRWELRGGCRNVLDARYETMKDYPLPGRSFYLETSVGFFDAD